MHTQKLTLSLEAKRDCNSWMESIHRHTHLEHLEDLEKAGVWEEGAVADTHAVSTPESHRTDETSLISSQGVRRH